MVIKITKAPYVTLITLGSLSKQNIKDMILATFIDRIVDECEVSNEIIEEIYEQTQGENLY